MHILLTGASGLIGGELAGLLADRGHAVTILARRPGVITRNDGIPLDAPCRTARPPSAGQLVQTAGDVGHDRLGLSRALHDSLAGSLDLIIHCAAVTGFTLDPLLYDQVNVGGVVRVLRLAETRRPHPVPLLHVSTAYVCGEQDGPVAEDALPTGRRHGNLYEASKARAEHLVEAARGRGVPAAIARPSIVVGAWRDGVIRRFDHFYALVRLLAQERIRALPATPDASLDLVPIDHVCAALVEIAEHMPQAAGRNFHLVSGSPMPVVALLATPGQHDQHFHVPRLISPDLFSSGMLSDAERRLYDRAVAPYASYLRRDPRFCDINLFRLCGMRCPATDGAFLQRLIGHCMASGFLASSGPQRADQP